VAAPNPAAKPAPVAGLDYPIFDCDNHYYEALDAFQRHVDPALGGRGVQWCEMDGRRYHVVGGRVSHAVRNATFHPISKPGCLYEFLRGNPKGENPLARLRESEPIPDHYRHPDARLRVMDAQGLEAIWLFPTLGVLYEQLLQPDVEAVTKVFTGFNRWLDEDWGLAYQGRIFAAPYFSLCDVEWACAELEWALARGARVLCTRPSAAWTKDGPRSPGDPLFDPFWARVNEAGITVVIHAGDSGYNTNGYADDRFSAFGGGGESSYGRPSVKAWSFERAALDFLATVIFDRLFERFPNLRVASVENGSEFLPYLFRKLESSGRNLKRWYREPPVETFRRRVWINPFWEDDVAEVAASMGPDRVLFGSDWPHVEGLPEPTHDLDAIRTHFGSADQRRILRDNVRALNELAPA
jgi:predicted TIM-barrel fold metal-dependent hydrolase